MKEIEYRLARTMPLEEWLRIILNSPNDKEVIDYQFPTDEHQREYIQNIEKRSEEDVCRILEKLLIPSGGLGIDQSRVDFLERTKEEDPERYEGLMRNRYYQRVFNYYHGLSKDLPWEGITWVLDLLPHSPKDALEGLNAYLAAHCLFLPDGRLSGMFDAAEIIRAKFIGLPGTNSEKIRFLLTLDWRKFECLVERLYSSMGYETQLTPPRRDGGRDVIATKRLTGSLEHSRIECKLYREEPVGLGIVQRLLGVVSGEKVNKGVVVTTSRFTKPARKYAAENPRLELIGGDQLVLLMNEHLGPSWPLHIERLVAESEANPSNVS